MVNITLQFVILLVPWKAIVPKLSRKYDVILKSCHRAILKARNSCRSDVEPRTSYVLKVELRTSFGIDLEPRTSPITEAQNQTCLSLFLKCRVENVATLTIYYPSVNKVDK